MRRKHIVIGIGELLWDVLPSGKKAGGAPVNFAFHAIKAGAEGYAFSAVGNDSLGDELLGLLEENQIACCVERVGYPTGTVDVDLKEGIPQYTICEEVAWDYIPLTEEMKKIADRADAISYGTLAQRNKVSRETTQALLRRVKNDAYKLYDINLRQAYYSLELIKESLYLANAFKINEEEIEMLKVLFSLDMENREMCRWFMEQYNLKLVILTAGAAYSSVFTPNKESTIETPRVEVIDTVGAGDSFSGVLITRLLQGSTLTEAHSDAVRIAAHVCSHAGAWVSHDLLIEAK